MADIKGLKKRVREVKEHYAPIGFAYKQWQQAVETQDVRRNSLYSTYRNAAVAAGSQAYELAEVLDLVEAELTKVELSNAEVAAKSKVAETPETDSGYVTGYKKSERAAKAEDSEVVEEKIK